MCTYLGKCFGCIEIDGVDTDPTRVVNVGIEGWRKVFRPFP